MTTMQGREQTQRVRSAVTKDGRILGVKVTMGRATAPTAVWPMTAGLGFRAGLGERAWTV